MDVNEEVGVDIELGSCKEVPLPGSGEVALNTKERDRDNGRRASCLGCQCEHAY